jgi:cytochrome c-type biogenesis protein CcmH
VAVYRRQLAEMESEHRLMIVSDDQFLRDRDELEQRVVTDLTEKSAAAGDERRHAGGSAGLLYAIAVGLPLAALFIYLALGAPSFIGTPP